MAVVIPESLLRDTIAALQSSHRQLAEALTQHATSTVDVERIIDGICSVAPELDRDQEQAIREIVNREAIINLGCDKHHLNGMARQWQAESTGGANAD